jgi:class 3 adenylate cyclase
VGKANVTRQALIEAIALFETQRGLTGDARETDRNIDTILAALREKLAHLQSEPGERSRHQLAILVADLSGFTALSEGMDAERVSDAINAMWLVLDAVISAWGGQIDQHAGDSLLAVFGLPHPRQSDAARTLHAALAMQQELDLFNERVRGAIGKSRGRSWAEEWPGPRMRIGVHSGLVYFAHAPGASQPGSKRPTAVGETVSLARRLEKLAPAGAVLTSVAVHRQTYHQFHFSSAAGNLVLGPENDPTFVVTGARPTVVEFGPETVAGQVTRLVGRAEQLDELELALQRVIDGLAPQLVTVVGPPGVGKSRLVHEFVGQARLLAGSPTILRAGTRGAWPDHPFALIRDLLLRRFDLRPQFSLQLIEHRLQRGLAELVAAQTNGYASHAGLPEHALELLLSLLDARVAATYAVDDVLATVKPLLRAISSSGPAIAIFEGINRADPQSLAVVDRLARDGDCGPVLFIAIATTAAEIDPAVPLPWLELEDDVFSPVERVNVLPLNAVESRLMATDVLRLLSPPSMRLLDLVVAEAGGNPLYIESFVRLLIERGVITVGELWRIDMAQAEATPLPVDLPSLIVTQLAQLPPVERMVLRHAAVFGPLCWDTALLEAMSPDDIDEAEVEAALLSLEMKRYLARDDVYSFAATQAYTFWRDTVRETIYAGVPASERRALHLQAAHWLVANQDDARLGAWLPIESLIAHHFAAAGDAQRAEVWRHRSGLAERVR